MNWKAVLCKSEQQEKIFEIALPRLFVKWSYVLDNKGPRVENTYLPPSKFLLFEQKLKVGFCTLDNNIRFCIISSFASKEKREPETVRRLIFEN